ncbi:uncharacterized protein [Narcine bancroftii]|uniref:uncharacterized protein n=1 Tax=Narcine bancroftii TaxID=1343680 RepID=UPI00383182DC
MPRPVSKQITVIEPLGFSDVGGGGELPREKSSWSSRNQSHWMASETTCGLGCHRCSEVSKGLFKGIKTQAWRNSTGQKAQRYVLGLSPSSRCGQNVDVVERGSPFPDLTHHPPLCSHFGNPSQGRRGGGSTQGQNITPPLVRSCRAPHLDFSLGRALHECTPLSLQSNGSPPLSLSLPAPLPSVPRPYRLLEVRDTDAENHHTEIGWAGRRRGRPGRWRKHRHRPRSSRCPTAPGTRSRSACHPHWRPGSGAWFCGAWAKDGSPASPTAGWRERERALTNAFIKETERKACPTHVRNSTRSTEKRTTARLLCSFCPPC